MTENFLPVDVPHRPTQAAKKHRELMTALAAFQTPSLPRSAWQFSSTVLLYLAVNAAMYAVAPVSVWLAVALAVPAGALVVRLFIVQHDCGHNSFFKSRRLNDLFGRFCSVITYTPYAFWRRQHANHHASFNNLDRRDTGIDLYSTCATLKEYLALPPTQRWLYRAIRHPAITQIVLPPFVFLVLYRLPFDAPRTWGRERRSVLMTNAALAVVLGGLWFAFGLRTMALVQFPIVAVAAIIDVWLFSVQHRFEDAMWERQEGWSHVQASMEGTSYLKLPRVLQWFTGNVGFHHVHHLAARVPNYCLQACHQAHHELHAVTVLTFREAIRAPFYSLWDEDLRRMVRFPA
jgi:omega-6 fatty acid desaturase (delta-12 desaturase)